MTEMGITGGLAEVNIQHVNTATASILLGEEKLLDFISGEKGKVIIYKQPRRKPIVVDAKELMLKLLDLLAS